MLWQWWVGMALLGLIIGGVGAWSQSGIRVLMRTLAAPCLVVLTRLLLPNVVPEKNTLLFAFVDYLILLAAALLADYAVGLKLGRNDRAGFREDSIGH